MVFSSIFFLFFFLPITLMAYFFVPKSFKNIVLLLASLFFYAWGEPVYVVPVSYTHLAPDGFGDQKPPTGLVGKQGGGVDLHLSLIHI